VLNHTHFFWSLPSPLAFCQAITAAAIGARAILVNHPAGVSLEHGVHEGLRNANISEPLVLIIEDGTNISNTLAPHFNNQIMHAIDLAGVQMPQPQAVVLRTTSERARQHCEKYMTEFVKALDTTLGNVRLVLSTQDASITRTSSAGEFFAIVYDGALKPEEMQAYVSYRMLGRQEFGTTTLTRHLATDFASYDVALADKLIQMDNNEILNLPQTLTQLIAEDENRWSSQEWLRGSASLTSPSENHPLREWYLASHSSPLTAIGKNAAEKRYWRACLKAISPWLEERRPVVLKELRPILQQLEANGQFVKKVGDFTETVDRDELEFNDLCYQHKRAKERYLRFTPRQGEAFSLCFLAKKVRNELAHSRKPALSMLQELVVAMDDFCRSA
jgi:hypothetical protein